MFQPITCGSKDPLGQEDVCRWIDDHEMINNVHDFITVVRLNDVILIRLHRWPVSLIIMISSTSQRMPPQRTLDKLTRGNL